MDKIVAATDLSFSKDTGGGLVLVDFWAPWCGPCRMLMPAIEQIATEYENSIKVVKVDVDECAEVPVSFGIRSIPCLVLLKDGVEKDRRVGAMSIEQLKKWLADFIETPYPVIQNPGVTDGILKMGEQFVVFIGLQDEVKQEGTYKTLDEAKSAYFEAHVAYHNQKDRVPTVYEMREVKEMKLVKIA